LRRLAHMVDPSAMVGRCQLKHKCATSRGCWPRDILAGQSECVLAVHVVPPEVALISSTALEPGPPPLHVLSRWLQLQPVVCSTVCTKSSTMLVV
jgi:hypothetical protein